MSNSLTDDERAAYEWQLWVAGFGEAGQRKLKASTVLVSRVGGVGGGVAMHLAAAGVGRIILAHAGSPRASDFNRQLLMSPGRGDELRVEQAARRLREFNPRLEVVPIAENIDRNNVTHLVKDADLVASCAPLFEERLLLNEAAVGLRTPLVDCAMYEMETQLYTVIPGKTACLRCLYPTPPANWKREFPVFGAVAGVVAALGALEIIKILAGLEAPLNNQILIGDLATMTFRKVAVRRDSACPECGRV